MNNPRWVFTVLLVWLFATMFSNALEPTAPYLLSPSVSGDISLLNNPSLASASGASLVGDWVGNIWKALSFDYSFFTGWLVILRFICVIFSIAGLFYIVEIFVAVGRVIYALLPINKN